jgi:hypothetical protein
MNLYALMALVSVILTLGVHSKLLLIETEDAAPIKSGKQ